MKEINEYHGFKIIGIQGVGYIIDHKAFHGDEFETLEDAQDAIDENE